MIVVFDAQCLLCNGSVRFLLRHDRRGVFRFASMQGKTGSALLARHGLSADEGLASFLLIDGERSWQQSAAVLRVLHALGWPWRLAWLVWPIPAWLRDAAYRFIARHRARVFGRSAVCARPPPGCAARFLD